MKDRNNEQHYYFVIATLDSTDLNILWRKTEMSHNDTNRVKILLQQASKISSNGVFKLLPVWRTPVFHRDVKDHLYKTVKRMIHVLDCVKQICTGYHDYCMEDKDIKLVYVPLVELCIDYSYIATYL